MCILVSTATVGFTAFDRFSIVRAGLKVKTSSTKYVIYATVIWISSLLLSLPYILNSKLVQTDYEDNIYQCKINWGQQRLVFILLRCHIAYMIYQYLETCESREKCLKTVIKELNEIGNATKLNEKCHFNIDQSQCKTQNILPVEKYYTLCLTALTFISPVVVLICAYCGLVKQVIYMEENMEKIGLGKGLRKNGSTTTNHIDNIVMGTDCRRPSHTEMANQCF